MSSNRIQSGDSHNTSYDVLIVGAGLAGLSAALELLHPDSHPAPTRVALIERHNIGSNNPTPMTFADVPSRFGLESAVIARYQGFQFRSPLGGQSEHQFDAARLVALDYRPACFSLLRQAQSYTVHSPTSLQVILSAAHRLKREGQLWRLDLANGMRLWAPLLIDASGRGLFASRALNLPRPRSYSHCYGARLTHCDIPDPDSAHFLAPSPEYGDGGGWLYPLGDGAASFGVAILGDKPTYPGGPLKTAFERARQEFQPYADWLRSARVDYVEAGSIPLYPLRRLVYDGLLIAGDAAAQATIWSCMGSHAALEAGQLAGQAARQALSAGDLSARSLAFYQQRWDKRHRRIYRRNAWIAPVVWSMSAVEWNRQIPRVQTLTPTQMLARLRINWPVPTLPQALFVRVYDLAGRTRRALVRSLRRLLPFLSTPPQPASPGERRKQTQQ